VNVERVLDYCINLNMKSMQKVLFIVGCVLGTFVCWSSTKSCPITNDLLLKNVEALAMDENSLPINCRDLGDFTCPNNGVKVGDVYKGYSLR